jgi:hypothetical protein
MSLETTMARAEANTLEQAWKGHKRHCPQCSVAAGRRDWDALCPDGAHLRAGHLEARRNLAENRRLDRQPAPEVPGQETLF